jgi:uncharacterized membrane protein required for colicin V production
MVKDAVCSVGVTIAKIGFSVLRSGVSCTARTAGLAFEAIKASISFEEEQ